MIEVTAAVIRNKDKILICQRPENKACGLFWEFPGGKLEAGETYEQCLSRECREELNIAIEVQNKLTEVVYDYGDRIVHIHFFNCVIEKGIPQLIEHKQLKWITKNEIAQYDFCPADSEMLRLI